MKELIIKKLTSRKFISIFLVEVAGVLTLVFGAGNPVTVIVGSALAVIAAVVYCITEGSVDATALQKEATDNLSLVMSVIANAGKGEGEGADSETNGENHTESESEETISP